jgi:peptidoglycan/LPS O-acetylase OafA/YrhL
MLSPALEGVFANAAIPQRIVLSVLVAAIPLMLVAAMLVVKGGPGAAFSRRFIADLRLAGLALGLLVGGLSSFHMGETILRLPFDPSLKQLAPGIFEVSTLVSLGALVSLLAVVAHAAIGGGRVRKADAEPRSSLRPRSTNSGGLRPGSDGRDGPAVDDELGAVNRGGSV